MHPALITASLLALIVRLAVEPVPLRTTLEIGADECFELAKATLSLKGMTSRRSGNPEAPPDSGRLSEIPGYSPLIPRLITM